MGNFGLSGLLRCVLLGAASLAAAFLAAVILAAPAAARPGSDNAVALKNWDSDNLRFGSYSSASFRIPSHSYGTATAPRYSHAACGHGGIADGFYQTRHDVNDFPVLQYTGGAHSIKRWGDADLACDEFVRAQERMATEAATNGGYYLDSQGNLKLEENVSSARFLRNPARRTRTYGTWSASSPARTGYQSLTRASSSDSAIPTTVKTCGILAHTASSPGCLSQAGGLALANGDADPYLARTDNSLANRGTSGTYERASSPQPPGAWDPSAAAISTQNEFVIRSGSVWYALAHRGICNRAVFLSESQDTGSDSRRRAGSAAVLRYAGVMSLTATAPLFAKAYMSVGEIAEACEAWETGDTARQLYQFIADWNACPEDRHAMLAGSPSPRNSVFQKAAIASVLRALCDRDGEVLPGWAKAARNPTPVTLDGISAGDGDGFGEIVRQESPLGCRIHNVFFEASELDKGKAVHG